MGPLAKKEEGWVHWRKRRRRRGGSTGRIGGGGGRWEEGGWKRQGVEMPGYNIFEKCQLFRSRID